jgi:hypothetical protein
MSAKRRVKRDYRQLAPAKFLSFAVKVRLSLTNNPNYPESMWGGADGILHRYSNGVDELEVKHHLASDGGHTLIRDRDKLREEIIQMLDQIASLLEGASILNPDALLSTGFSITQERRSTPRVRLPLQAPADFTVINLADIGKAKASAGAMPGAWNNEIHVNTKDPSVEDHWGHHGIYNDPSEMLLENLSSGNNFVRSRYHGPDGAGPWSNVVSVTIT